MAALDMLDDAAAVARFLAGMRIYDQKNIERALVNAMNCTPEKAKALAEAAIANTREEG